LRHNEPMGGGMTSRRGVPLRDRAGGATQDGSRPADSSSALLGHGTCRGPRTLARTHPRMEAGRDGVVGAGRVPHHGGVVGDDHPDVGAADASAPRVDIPSCGPDRVDVHRHPDVEAARLPPACPMRTPKRVSRSGSTLTAMVSPIGLEGCGSAQEAIGSPTRNRFGQEQIWSAASALNMHLHPHLPSEPSRTTKEMSWISGLPTRSRW